jgi:hypothetical protein
VKGLLPLLGLRLKQAWAGRLPFLILVQLALVGGLIVLAPSVTPEARLRLIVGGSIAIAGLIATVGGVAFGASLLPDERETRRIHRLLAAPVGRAPLAVSTLLSGMLTAFGLAVALALTSLPLLYVAGTADTRREVLRSTLRLPAASVEAAGESSLEDDMLWIFGKNPGVRFEIPLDPDDLDPGDVHGRIEVVRKLDVNGTLTDVVPLEVRVEGTSDTRTVEIGPDEPVHFTVPADIARSGTIRVVLSRPEGPEQPYAFGVTPASLVVNGRTRSFVPEYALAATGAGLVAALLTAFGVALSSIATTGVAVAGALAIGLIGSMRGFLSAAAENLGHGAHQHGGPPAVPTALDRIAAWIVDSLASLSPDVSALALGGPLRDGSTFSAGVLQPGLLHFAIGTLIALVLGWLLLLRREYP